MTVSAVEPSLESPPALRPATPLPAPPGAFAGALESARATQPRAGSVHEVREGDTLSEIVLQHFHNQGRSPSQAELYTAVADVARANGVANPDRIYPGQAIVLETPRPLNAEAPAAPIPVPAADVARERLVRATLAPELPLGGPKQSPQSFASVRLETFRQVATELSEFVSRPIRYAKGAESLLRFLPVPAARNHAAAVASLRAAESAPVEPVESPDAPISPWKSLLAEPARLTCEFGPRKDPFDGSRTHHDGIDLAAKRGTEIFPFKAGTVKFSGWMPGYGNVVVVDHADGLETVYAHNAKNLVRKGERVTETDALGTVGSTGRSTGPHLHFEIRRQGRPLDPIPIITEPMQQP